MADESTLKNIFAKANEKKKVLDSGDVKRNSPEHKELTNHVVDLLIQALRLADSQALFSTNEQLEDVATTDLKYLALEYLLASTLEVTGEGVITRITGGRSALVEQAIAYYIAFLKKLNDYHILPKELSRRIDKATTSTTTTTTTSSSPQEGSSSSFQISSLEATDPASRRAEKIELFKLEKSLDSKLKQVYDQPESSSSEELLRQMEISRLGLYALKALTSLQTLDMERNILKNRPSQDIQDEIELQRRANDPVEQRRIQQQQSGSTAADRFTTRVEQLPQQTPILNSNGKVNRPFTIVSSRDQIRKNVFGTGQMLPTMTVDEYLQEEIKRGGIIQGGGASSKVDPDEAKADEDNEAKADAETYKMREWDEFTDANPRGSGNRHNIG